MKSNRAVVIVVTLTLLSIFGRGSFATTCRAYTDCSSCTSSSSSGEEGCMWALLYNCTEVCIEKNYTDPDGFKARDVIWRSAVSNGTECANKEWCKIMEGDVPNPSFEEWTWKKYSKKESKKNSNRMGVTEHKPWIFARTISVWNYTAIYKELNNAYMIGLDGEFFLYMGGNNLTDTLTFEVRLDNKLRISKGATHLSFFYALPYYSKYFRDFYPFIDRTALDVYIDNEHLLHMYAKNIDKIAHNNTDAYYHPMNIDISRFADGKTHSLKFYFSGPSIEKSWELGQLMLIDYIQVIKSNLNGSTFDGWDGAPFDRETSCPRYCLGRYIGDGVCDMVCMTKECKNDGDNTGPSTKAIVVSILCSLCGVVVVSIVVVFVVLWKKGYLLCRGVNSSGYKLVGSNVKLKNKKKQKKRWYVSTKNLVYGGKEATIGVALKDTLTVTNTGKPRTFTVTLADEARCNSDMRFEIVIKPREFKLEKNEEQTINVFVKFFCTTTITERIELRTIEAPSERKTINVVARGKMSTRINPYYLKIGDVIGEGNFGVVYRGIYKNTLDVAVKKLKFMEDQSIEEFNKEADILEKIQSDCTVKFYGALITKEYYCFVTEYIPYGPLSLAVHKIIPADPNGGKRILCALNAARALRYLHEHKILYRDLKPENVLVSSNVVKPVSDCVVCKLTDFGSSKTFKSKESMTKAIGTPLYMAPEVITTNSYGKESDVYSFGASFIQIWTGKQPFFGTDFQFYEFIKKIATDPLDVACPLEVVNLVNRCLSRDPGSRPSFDEIVSVLNSLWMSLSPKISDLKLFHT